MSTRKLSIEVCDRSDETSEVSERHVSERHIAEKRRTINV